MYQQALSRFHSGNIIGFEPNVTVIRKQPRETCKGTCDNKYEYYTESFLFYRIA